MYSDFPFVNADDLMFSPMTSPFEAALAEIVDGGPVNFGEDEFRVEMQSDFAFLHSFHRRRTATHVSSTQFL